MNKRIINIFAIILCGTMISGCSNGNSNIQNSTDESLTEASESAIDDTEITTSSKVEIANNKIDIPEGMYLSELTGEPIDSSLEDQRPIAVVIDNDFESLPHYGTTEADVVYELINTTRQDRITRLLCVIKDWRDIKKLGNIRSAQPTHVLLAAEFNAVLCHDGSPWYTDVYFEDDKYSDHFTGVFSKEHSLRDNLYEKYILYGDMDNAFTNSIISTTYSKTYSEYNSKFKFIDYGTTVDLDLQVSEVTDVTEVILPFYHNESTLKYNEETEKYEYYEYGTLYQEAEDDKPLAFDNVIIQNTGFHLLDDNGYLEYYFYRSDFDNGYYITKGQCIPIYWDRDWDTDIVHYYADASYTQEIQINTGKTYIALVPSDTWEEVSLNN